MIFGVLTPDKIWHQRLVHWPSHLYIVATLPWEIKTFLDSIIHTYSVLQIIYVISEEKKLLFPYPPHLKNVTALPCKMRNFFIWF